MYTTIYISKIYLKNKISNNMIKRDRQKVLYELCYNFIIQI